MVLNGLIMYWSKWCWGLYTNGWLSRAASLRPFFRLSRSSQFEFAILYEWQYTCCVLDLFSLLNKIILLVKKKKCFRLPHFGIGPKFWPFNLNIIKVYVNPKNITKSINMPWLLSVHINFHFSLFCLFVSFLLFFPFTSSSCYLVSLSHIILYL